MECIVGLSGYVKFVKGNLTAHPKLHPHMVMFILEKMVLRVELEGVSAAYATVSTMPVTVLNLVSSVESFDSRFHYFEATTGLEVGKSSGSVEKCKKKPDQKEWR